MPKGLFAGPKGVTQGGCVDPQGLRRKFPGRPAMQVGHMRRLNEHDATLAVQSGQGRLQQSDFANARTFEGKLDQGPDRPATAR